MAIKGVRDYRVTYYDKGTGTIQKQLVSADSVAGAIKAVKWNERGNRAGISRVKATLWKR
jgi:hypothetical protein